MKNLKDSSLIICSIVRDAERGLRANIPVVQELCKQCKDYRVVVFENDSKDHTKEILGVWSAGDPEHVFTICADLKKGRTIPRARDVKVNPFFSHSRIDKMNRLRNQYLDYVEQHGWTADYLIVVDLDVAQLYLEDILNSFEAKREWDAVTAFGYSTSPRLKLRYHDTYALIKCEDQKRPQTEEMIIAHADELGTLKPTDDWVHLYSGFGGLAIYRFEAIRGLRYEVIENDDPRVEVLSEHVGLYRQMVARGYDRIYLNPAMRIHYQKVTLKIAWASLLRKINKIVGKCGRDGTRPTEIGLVI